MIDDGGPAYPVTEENTGRSASPGMTLRDHFAAAAMQGWLATYGEDAWHPASNEYGEYVAQMSYAMADAMLLASGK